MLNPAQEHTEQIIRYLDAEMTDEEKQEFEILLVRNKELLDEYRDLQIARDSVRFYGLKQKVAEIHQLMMEELKPGKPPVQGIKQLTKLVRYGIAVAAGILLVLLFIMTYKYYSLSTEGLFGEKYNDFIVSAVTDDTSTSSRIEKSYRNAKYQEIIFFHNKIHFIKVKDLFFLGIAYLKTENLTKAIESFNSILNKNKLSQTDTLQDETEYYLALTYLKNKDYDQAIVLMKKIHADPDHLYHAKFTGTYIQRVKMLKWR
jgi:tetratricopeptide (TPR) repeat protein